MERRDVVQDRDARLRAILMDAVEAATARSKELGQTGK